jgi:retron-type reverse transcriptase
MDNADHRRRAFRCDRRNRNTVNAEDREMPAGRTLGTPQGGVISPLLAYLFLHYAFDRWMRRSIRKWNWKRCRDGKWTAYAA